MQISSRLETQKHVGMELEIHIVTFVESKTKAKAHCILPFFFFFLEKVKISLYCRDKSCIHITDNQK